MRITRDDPLYFDVQIPPKNGKTARITERPTPRYPAVFDGKALKIASDCPAHPKYQALRPPRSKAADCVCAEIWNQKGERIGR